MYADAKKRAENKLRNYLDRIVVWQSHNRKALADSKRSFAYAENKIKSKMVLFHREGGGVDTRAVVDMFKFAFDRFEAIAVERTKASDTRLANIRNLTSTIMVKKLKFF